MTKSVCIIGAGQAGLAAIKSSLEEGLSPFCVEKREDLGGMWNRNYREDIKGSRAYKSLITNVSKEASCFSDFPYPKEYPPFITCAQFHQYLKIYTSHFSLTRYIEFNTEVIGVEENNDDKISEGLLRWSVTKRDVNTGDVNTNEFDCIIVCVGNRTIPSMPRFNGLYDGTFKGRVIHSLYYDTAKDLEEKRVLVIGFGNSGADIAVDVSHVASHTSLSTRSGAWVVPRMFKNGLPQDLIITTRFTQMIRSIFPKFLTRAFAENLVNSRINHNILGIKSRYSPLSNQASLLINDDLPSRIVSGKVKIKTDVQKFEGNNVFYADGTMEHIDFVILATGLKADTSCFSSDLIPDDRADMKFYIWIFPFEIADPSSFAVMGVIPPAGGSLIPIVELQSRYVAQVMSGRKQLPPVKIMRSRYAKDREKCIIDSGEFRFMNPVGLDYVYQLADLCGVNPSFWKLLFRDPKLAFAIFFGPMLSYQFRLIGRHAWDGARERILNVIANTLHGLRVQQST